MPRSKHRSRGPLRSQKPMRRRNAKKQKKLLSSLFALLLLGLLPVIGYGIYLYYEPQVLPKISQSLSQITSSISPPFLRTPTPGGNHTSGHPSKRWRISVRGDHKNPPPPRWKDEIVDLISHHIQSGHRDELAHLARILLRRSTFDQVQMTRIAPDHVLVEVRMPEALALIEADRLRFLSPRGHIFGQARATDYPNLPRITGVFEPLSHASSPAASGTSPWVIKHNKLMVPPATEETLSEILVAFSLLEKNHLMIATLHHDPYRGVHTSLTTGENVDLGHPPYEKKVQRLITLLSDARDKGESLKKIELDFRGKAFIKAQLGGSPGRQDKGQGAEEERSSASPARELGRY